MRRMVLSAVWRLNFLGERASAERVVAEVRCPGVGDTLHRLSAEGLVEEKEGGYFLTRRGRKEIKVVMAGGVFDILHPGHAYFLRRAKELGDVLVVVVARDSTVTRRKRIPVVPEEQRVDMVAELKPVDVALLGEEGDIYATVQKVMPDIIALGPDQRHGEDEVREELRRRGLSCEVVRIREYKECALHSTRSILQRIIELNYPDKRLERES